MKSKWLDSQIFGKKFQMVCLFSNTAIVIHVTEKRESYKEGEFEFRVEGDTTRVALTLMVKCYFRQVTYNIFTPWTYMKYVKSLSCELIKIPKPFHFYHY